MVTSNEDVSLYTIGHSRHTIDTFIDLAENFGISLFIDVRGQPYSRFNPQYNRAQLNLFKKVSRARSRSMIHRR